MPHIIDREGKVIGHVLVPRGHYLAQVRRIGCRNWRNVGNAKTRGNAMAKAAKAMRSDDHRARVLFIDSSGWYEPNLVMEAVRK